MIAAHIVPSLLGNGDCDYRSVLAGPQRTMKWHEIKWGSGAVVKFDTSSPDREKAIMAKPNLS